MTKHSLLFIYIVILTFYQDTLNLFSDEYMFHKPYSRPNTKYDLISDSLLITLSVMRNCVMYHILLLHVFEREVV